MHRAVFTWWCNFTAEAGKTRRVYHVQAFHNYAAFLPCHTYVGRMKVRSGTTLPQFLDNLMLWLQNQLITQKQSPSGRQFSSPTAYVLNWMLTKLPFVLHKCPANERANQECLNGFSNMAVICLVITKDQILKYTIIFQVTFYKNVVYKLLHPLNFWGRILHFFTLKGMPCRVIKT